MDKIKEKLAYCFSLTFPQMDPSQYPTASVDNTSGWDSITQMTLLTLIGEEFKMDIDFLEFEGATSFESLASRISELSPAV